MVAYYLFNITWPRGDMRTASDDFVRQSGEPALPLAWQWNHNPDHRH